MAAKAKRSKQTEVMVKSSSDIDYEQIIRDVTKMQLATAQVQGIVSEEISKSWKQVPNTDPKRSAKSWFMDPLSLQYSLGYKDRRFSLTYDTLKRMAQRLSVVSAIINLRSSQVAAFSEPYGKTRSLGFRISHKDPNHHTTPAERAFIKELEQFILNCGRSEPNPYSSIPRDDFENFLRKIVRDTLVLDAVGIEVVPDNFGIPYEFMAVDASTIRIASDNRYVGVNASYTSRDGFIPGIPGRFQGLYEGRSYGSRNAEGDLIDYVQVVNGQIENVYSRKELAYGIRNPRSDIYSQGYGLSELEMLITTITAHLYAEEWNIKFFSQGANPRGILNLKGENWTPEMLEAFKRQWSAQVSGIESSWKTPVLQSEGLEWIDFGRTNSEMGYQQWMEYLIKCAAAVYLVDPSEINFESQGGLTQTPLFESSQEWKLKASRDRGLKPLLKFISRIINKNIIDQIDPHFTLEFVGLDEPSEEEKHEMMIEEISSYRTLNEGRRKLDLPDLPGGDFIMSPTYLNALELELQMKGMMPQQGAEGGQDQQGVPGAGAGGGDGSMEDPGPQYSDLYTAPAKGSS